MVVVMVDVDLIKRWILCFKIVLCGPQCTLYIRSYVYFGAFIITQITDHDEDYENAIDGSGFS